MSQKSIKITYNRNNINNITDIDSIFKDIDKCFSEITNKLDDSNNILSPSNPNISIEIIDKKSTKKLSFKEWLKYNKSN
jgi:hydroxymethylpyrimidine pyrophosphatase-like HAD family hydrolase